MGKILVLTLSLVLMSCSSFKGKKDPVKYIQIKTFSLAGEHAQRTMKYYSTTENDDHCFKDNLQNKEIITVDSENTQFAIDHFYKRTTKVDITRMHSMGVLHVDVKTTEETDYELEVASCLQTDDYFLVHTDRLMTSFRLKN
jgi:hypothetical protein